MITDVEEWDNLLPHNQYEQARLSTSKENIFLVSIDNPTVLLLAVCASKKDCLVGLLSTLYQRSQRSATTTTCDER